MTPELDAALQKLKQQMYEKAGLTQITLPINSTVRSATAVRELEQVLDEAYEEYINDSL